ncbi:MAG: hypothetical protein HZB33_00915 [Nitrospirae bacterium]|nr:hypothetical protein [Nitrospirota bacterium]
MKEIWVFLFLLGLLFFDWPLIEIAVSFLHYYLFAAWGIFIVVVHLVIRLTEKKGANNV